MNCKRYAPVNSLLVVDDDAQVRGCLRHALRSLGVTAIYEATNGWEGVAEYFSTKPDVVLMDIHMPELNGPDAVRELRRLAPEARVVMMSSEATLRRVREAIRLGAFGFLRKDVPMSKLVPVLERILSTTPALRMAGL
ncbi:MAG: response regulator transcription factor [Opitutales bacterium]